MSAPATVWASAMRSRDLQALVVTAVVNIKDLSTPDNDTLYSKNSPATLILACDKTLCRDTANGVPHLRVVYTLINDGALNTFADPCPSKAHSGRTASSTTRRASGRTATCTPTCSSTTTCV